MKTLLLLLPLIFAIGCAGKLRPDTTMPAAKANYPTAEIHACGQKFVGIGICPIVRGSAITVGIQGYYSGAIRIDSERCHIATSQRYSNSGEVRQTLVPTESCVVDVVVSPEYPDEAKSGLAIGSLKGRLYIKMLEPGNSYQTMVSKIPLGTSQTFAIRTSEFADSRVIFRGCDTQFDRTIAPINGVITIGADELIAAKDPISCIFEGVVFGNAVYRLGWQAWWYDAAFNPLPIPDIAVNGNKIKIVGDAGVSVIALNQKYVINKEATFTNFNPAKPNILRLLTVGGRLALGQWNGREFIWTR